MLEDLKIMNKETIKETFRIIKPGHLDKMYKAIQRVQYPSECKCRNCRKVSFGRRQAQKCFLIDTPF